jgi:hypothetical protein
MPSSFAPNLFSIFLVALMFFFKERNMAEPDDYLALTVRLDGELRTALDRYRRSQESPPSRARAGLELIRLGLAQSETGFVMTAATHHNARTA